MKHPAELQFVEHNCPAVQPRVIFMRFLAASAEATDIVIAKAATAPATRNFVANFVMIKDPLIQP